MKSVRRFFGRLCGSSGRRLDENKSASPVSPPKENEEKGQIEPSLLPDDAQSRGDKDETLKEYFTQSSYESLNESPNSRKKQTSLKAACSAHCIYDVAEWKPESLGTQSTDKVFNDAAELMEPFFKQTQSFSSLLLKFARQYSKEKKPNFFKCYQVYLKNKATDGLHGTSNHSESNIMNMSDDDLKDPTVKQLKEIAMSGTKLVQLIDTIKPQVAERIDEASKYDVKDAVKEKKNDSVSQQSGLLSKFSTPGKIRRNLKQLKENHKLLGFVHSEVESIILVITDKGMKATAVTASNQEMERSGSPTLLSMVSVDDPVSQGDVAIDSLQVQSSDAPVLIGTDNSEGNHEVPELTEEQQTLVVEENPEVIDEKETVNIDIKPAFHQEDFQKNEIDQLNDSDKVDRELGDKILPLKSDPSGTLESQANSSSQDNVDFGRLLDFGSYIVVDPSVSDEVMLRGSRSLDSLCSVSSRRTLSKYGSYEFVTDFELKIAEKAENQRQQFMENSVPKKTKTKRTKNRKSGKQSGSRDVSSPIYKYTEVDYNPMGF